MNTIEAGNDMRPSSEVNKKFISCVEDNLPNDYPQVLVNECSLTGKLHLYSFAAQLRARSY